jgi:hypothetical protein
MIVAPSGRRDCRGNYVTPFAYFVNQRGNGRTSAALTALLATDNPDLTIPAKLSNPGPIAI